jgi:hypothetical protein
MSSAITPGSEGNPWQGSNLDALIERILHAMANPHPDLNGITPFRLEKFYGDESKTSMWSPPMLVWSPKYDASYDLPHEQPDDGVALLETMTYCEVTCWGGTGTQAEALRNNLLITLQTTFSANSEKPQGKGEWSQARMAGTLGIRVKFMVGLRVPIYAQIFDNGLIATINQGTSTSNSVRILDPLGGNPEPLP